jgi:methionyl-tRNA formyltransferase
MNRLKVYKASIVQGDFAVYNNGDIISCDSKNGLIVKCGDGAVSLDIIQSAGTKAMPAKDYLRGRKLNVVSFK